MGCEVKSVRGAEWESGEWRTSYAGEEKMRRELDEGGDWKDVKGAGASLRTDDRAAGEGVKSGEARRRMDADAERRAAARAAGESEYDSALPEGFAGEVMDLEESGGVFKGRGDAAYEYMRDRDVARDVVARLFARASGLEAGD